MSLINQVLMDLEQRGAQPVQEPQLHADTTQGKNLLSEIRPVAVPRRPRRRLTIGWLLLLGAVLAVSISLWNSQVPVREMIADARQRIDALLSGSEDVLLSVTGTTPPEKAQAQPQQAVQAQVNAALMVPVFQLSDELANLPTQPKRVATEPRKRAPAVSKKTKAVPVAAALQRKAAPDKTASPAGKQRSVAALRKKPSETSHEAAETTITAKKEVSGPAETGAPSIMKSAANEAPEEIVIPADLAQQPIEKQDRQLTAYERAENTFRQGVASLRKGRISEAEAKFREALAQDRSHMAARQALIGLLVDSGRLADARSVLAEALDANPRQPGLAMLLARLQVESNELGAALQTLERTSPYAGTEADYRAMMAAVLQRTGRHDEAVQQYRDALTLKPGNAVWMMGMGISLRALGENKLAKEVFESAAAKHTLDPNLQAFVEQQQRELEHALN